MWGSVWDAGAADAGRFGDSRIVQAVELLYGQGSINPTLTAKTTLPN
jgi:hypothetical protein